MEPVKTIKDYLHLYPKVPIAICEPGIEPVGHYLEGVDWVLNKAIAERANYPFEWIKPILRPLSDMTYSEAVSIEADWIELNHESEEVVAISFPSDYSKLLPEDFLFLLSKHFDLFGLIDAGLAIDKSTIDNK
jgi:hypothetical protein